MAKTQTPDLDDVTIQIAKPILSMPPKQHKDMKFGKSRVKAEPKERPASKGRVHKGRTRD
jgi:hypothetical protein